MKRLSIILLVFIGTFITSQLVMATVTTEELGKMLLGTNYAGITQPYNQYYSLGPTSNTTKGGCHAGIDYRAISPLTIYSPVKGVVANTPYGGSFGSVSVKIEGTNTYFIFLHLSHISVNKGAKVNVGTVIGKTGQVGAPGQPHLHVETRNGKSISSWYFKVDKYGRCSDTGENVNPTSVVSPPRTLSKLIISGSNTINENQCQYYSVYAHYTNSSRSVDVTNKVYWGNSSWLTKGDNYGKVCASDVSRDSYTELTADYNEGGIYKTAKLSVTVKNKTISIPTAVRYINQCVDKFSDYFGNKDGSAEVCFEDYYCQNTTGGTSGDAIRIAVHKSQRDVFWYFWGGWSSLELSYCE